MYTTSHNTEEQAPKMAAEPTAVYRTAAGGESLSTMCNTTVSKPGRMTVDDYFDILHKMVDEYYDSIQGWD